MTANNLCSSDAREVQAEKGCEAARGVEQKSRLAVDTSERYERRILLRRRRQYL